MGDVPVACVNSRHRPPFDGSCLPRRPAIRVRAETHQLNSQAAGCGRRAAGQGRCSCLQPQARGGSRKPEACCLLRCRIPGSRRVMTKRSQTRARFWLSHRLAALCAMAAMGSTVALVSADQSPRTATMLAKGGLSNYQNIPLWEAGKVPLATGDGPLDNPFLTDFQPPPGKRSGDSVIIAPGGANIMLMYGAEGFEVGERYNEWGVTAFVLTYRLSPKYNNQARVMDGQRAVRTVRANAAAWGL